MGLTSCSLIIWITDRGDMYLVVLSSTSTVWNMFQCGCFSETNKCDVSTGICIQYVYNTPHKTVLEFAPAGAVLLRDIQALTLYRGRYTTARRSSPVPQLQCVGGSAGCQAFIPDVVQCQNKGWDGVDVQVKPISWFYVSVMLNFNTWHGKISA